MVNVTETVAFVVHAVKQFCFGFERVYGIADEYQDGSPAKAFYLSALYNYVAIFYLLDRSHRPMGGALYPALERHGLQHLLNPIRHLLDQPLGTTSFGEFVRLIRNKAIVHPGFRDADVDDAYGHADMQTPENQQRFQELLAALHVATRELAWHVVKEAGLRPEDFGIRERQPTA